jgi:arylsulfatase A-like enzyme
LAEPRQFKGYQSDVVSARAQAWLEEQRSPWFAVVSLEAPHPPYLAPANGVQPASPAEILLPPNVPRGDEAESRARRELAGYYAHIAATDRAIGRLLNTSETRLNTTPTIVVFTSVHGDMHGAHGLFRKGWPYEESVRIPLLVGGLAICAETRNEPASLLDLRRWTVSWADGAPSLHSAAAAQISMPSVVALPDQCDRSWRGVRTRTRKLILQPDGSPWLFFDLEKDPWEMQNLAADPNCRAEIESLRTRIVA